jgi:16S rRNA (uracil1498-N3)-methyltransferase
METRPFPRLYTESDLRQTHAVEVTPDQSHYLKNVMRLKPGDSLRLFNGRDGEWRGEIGKISKRMMEIAVLEPLKPQSAEPDVWLGCAPIKKTHFDFMIEKATELGVSAIQPVLTQRTQVREVKAERCRAIAIEAAEQSERLSVPEIKKMISLKELAAQWPADRALIVCAEWGEAMPAKEALALPRLKSATKTAIVTGPEGGFAEEELDILRHVKDAVFIRLGPRILRADTAAIAALSVWQAVCGDWSLGARL